MGGKRLKRGKGKGGGGGGSQNNFRGREGQSPAARQPQEPPTDNEALDYTKHINRNNNGAGQQNRASDPPDDSRSISSRRSSTSRNNNSNRERQDRRIPNGHLIHGENQCHNDYKHDPPLLDLEEQLQYDQYQDQYYHQQFMHPQQTNRQDESLGFSSSHRQFNLAPLDVEMTSLSSKVSREQKAKKEERRLAQQQKAERSRFSLGRYETVNSNHYSDNASESDSDGGSDDSDDDESSEHEIKTHEEFYNYGDDDDDDDDDDDTDDEEERPLRRSRSSNKLRLIRRRGSTTPIMTRCERFQNRLLIAAFAMVALLFIRDHTPWWKKHKALVEFQKHHHHHTDGSADDDFARNAKLDPMAVYNTNDDDSTHTKDHDPLHKYVKEGEHKVVHSANGEDSTDTKHLNRLNEFEEEELHEHAKGKNKLDEHTAGERISIRPAQKSMNHGFMDETYENRPVAKNSASTAAAAAAGVNIDGSGGGLDEEDVAFLNSVKGKPEQYAGDGNHEQFVPPPPPIPAGNDGTPEISSEVRPQSERSPTQASVLVQTAQHQQQEQILSNEYDDNLVEWGGQQEQHHPPEPNQNIANIQTPIQSPQSKTFESVSSSSTGYKPMANDAMNGSAFMSNSLNAQSAQEIKAVYQNSYYRWNHPFRVSAVEGDGRDVPVFWRIPRSASSVFENVMVNCYHLSLASALGTRQGHDQDQALGIVTLGNAKYVNVDMSNPAGIQRAKAMNLGKYGMVDAISTPFLYETASIFQDVSDSGKCFTLLRHPVDRAVSLYHHYQSDDGNPNTAQYKGMSIDEYAERSTESNWMVRFLTNKRAGALSWHDLEAAKEVFGRKCLVGLVEKAEESIRRYERFFGWGDSKYNACVGERLANSDKRNQHDTFEGTNAWEALRKKNEYDVLLYEYAKNLYTQQSTMFESFH